ncbi:MAG: Ig-like domain-containing protein [Rikenellaceae bacterium]|nr:Ig-like domain-containing protein [Rikenellaceae bacterium]
MRSLIRYIAVVSLFACAFVFYTGCANPSAPTGGPKDTLPPRILSMMPANYATWFKGGRITITFDEYVQLKDVQKEVIISPPLERRPMMSVKGRSVIIDFRDDIELDSATTYKIDFGKAIVDNNEGNVLYGFSYVFSTGGEIDSLAMSGQVVDAFRGDSLFNATLLFFDGRADSMSYDSTLFIGKPLSTARTDSLGVFLATNLKPMDYRIYAIADENGNGRYEPGTDRVAFLDSVYNPALMPPFKVWWNRTRMRIEAEPQVTMRAFDEIAVRRQALTKITRTDKCVLSLEFAARSPRSFRMVMEGVDSSAFIFRRSRYGDTVDVWIDTLANGALPDTLKGFVEFMTVDSLGRDSLGARNFRLSPLREPRREPRKDEKPANPFKVDVRASSPLNPYSSIDFIFKVPLRRAVPDSIKLTGEVKEEPKEGPRGDRRLERNEGPKEAVFEPASFTFERDSIDILKWRLKSSWRPDSRYRLEILPDAFVDIYGHANDTLKADFSVMNPDDYTEINLAVKADSSKSYIVQLADLKGDTRYSEAVTGSGELCFDYVEPGVEYRIRIVEDSNGNGVWDGGDLVGRVFPERVAFFSDDAGKSVISTKAKWNIVLTLDMNHIFDGTQTTVTNAIAAPGEAVAGEKELPVSDDEEDEL